MATQRCFEFCDLDRLLSDIAFEEFSGAVRETLVSEGTHDLVARLDQDTRQLGGATA